MKKRRVSPNQSAMDLMDSFQQKSQNVGGAASEHRMPIERDENPLKLDVRLSGADREEELRLYCVTVPK